MNRLTACLLLAAAASGALAACHRKQPTPPAVQSSQPVAPVIVVSGARLVLPAVPGNPAALYLTVANPTEATIRLTGLAVAGASSTELHQTTGGSMAPIAGLDITPGAAVGLAPGASHAMVFGLKPAPTPGSEVAITLKFANGSTIPATAKVDSAGSVGVDAMPGMTGPMEGHDMAGTEGTH